MHLLDPLNKDYAKLSDIYEKIYSKNAVSFLGAGASVTNKQFLSKELISLYQARINKDFGTTDIVKFVDILQATSGQRRSDFDRFVVDVLSKLEPNEGHNIFVTIPWKQIITTNFDTLIEEASTNALKNNRTHYTLKIIRNKRQLDYQAANNEVTCIKLNGCKTDLSLCPLVFSSDDFTKQASFYKKVLSPFKQFSNDIIYLSFGYSFSDDFADKLLTKLLDNDYRQKRLVYCIDPYVNEDKLGYFESQNISIVKITFEEFFVTYQKWFEDNQKNYLKKLQKFTNPDDSKIPIEVSCRLFLDKNLVQLKDDYRAEDRIKKIDFYIGEEPNYQVILDEFDVVKKQSLDQLLKLISRVSVETQNTSIPKLILVQGDFGSGKTTFTLRVIKEYLRMNSTALAFEVIKGVGIKKGYISQLIKESTATEFIFYCDNIETDSIFKAFNELRIDIATEQYSNIKIIFISSIRQNILSKFKTNQNLSINNSIEFDYNSQYNDEELRQLVDNLKEVGLVNYRDLTEKSTIIYRIKKDYKGDSFITLYKLIQNGYHYKLLQKAYDELTSEIKLAFKIVALIHRFGIYCPVSVVKNSMKTMDWPHFTESIVKGDGRNILFQESRSSTTSDPDLFFRTKHPIIAEALIKTVVRNTEKNSLYKSIFSSLTFSEFNSSFIVDLIKSIRLNDADITGGQIDNYYEICKKEFEISPHFLTSYITNIEKKTNSIATLKQCIKDVELLEADLDYRNNRLIHRKGSLNFKIARILFQQNEPISEVKHYISTAEDWFFIKKQLDPSSNYSYIDYLNLLLWKLRNISLNDDDKLELNLSINNLFDEAFRLLSQNTQIIYDLFDEYNSQFETTVDRSDYLDFLLDQYQSVEKRPVACILLYYYYEKINDSRKCKDLVEEIKMYNDNKEIIYFLFKYYGRNLYNVSNRMKFFELIRYNDFLKDYSPFRYYYFSGISEFYNYRWFDGRELLNELRSIKQSTFNPDFFLYWCDNDGTHRIFDAKIILDKKVKKVQITSPFFKQFVLVNGNYRDFKDGDAVNVKLRFLFEGIRAEIVNERWSE